MKQKIIVMFLVFFFIIGCSKESNEKYVERKTGLDLSSCEIERDENTHGGFHGDGEKLVVFSCNNDNAKILNQISKWKSLPLTENLDLIMYGGIKDGVTYSYELATKNKMPKITDGYYKFINRHSSALDEHDDDIFNKYSFNFTLVLYDRENNKMYYFEFDS